MEGSKEVGRALDSMGVGVKIAEQQREKEPHTGFLGSVFSGRPDFSLMFPWREQLAQDKEREELLKAELKAFFEKIDPDIIDGHKDLTPELIKEMGQMGMFALKIPTGQYGGRGLKQTGYNNVIGFISSLCPAIAILCSADNTIGGKFPVMYFGTQEQKDRLLPELTTWPSGFCFTEDRVGSDPARMQTCAVRVFGPRNEVVGYRISGEKWYTTNSVFSDTQPLAKYLAVVARIVSDPAELADQRAKPNFGIFIVPTVSRGFTILQRTKFMGMVGIFNGILSFQDVAVAADGLIGGEGAGFKIAMKALTTGRVAIAGSCAASAKQCFSLSRWRAMKRHQWGGPIIEKELIGSGMITPAAYNTLAMEAVTNFAASRIDRGQDARLEATACKVLASELSWTITDNMVQIFGGTGYETQESLARREEAAPVERLFRDARPNRIFEGSTQILTQWLAREGEDDYIKRGAPFKEPSSFSQKFKAAKSFAVTYAKLLVPGKAVTDVHPRLRRHVAFVEKNTRKLNREIIYHSGASETKRMIRRMSGKRFFSSEIDIIHHQLLHDRISKIAFELYAIAATCAYADFLSTEHGTMPIDLADLFCRESCRRVRDLFRALGDNDDVLARAINKRIIAGDCAFLEEGILKATDRLKGPQKK